MVRLVFRPYTQVWRTICTSVTLRASTRVSPGFTLLKRSSPSFGSYQICSYSIPSYEESRLVDAAHCWHLILSFLTPPGFCTLWLAYGVDSLVRVSRRVNKNHFGKISIRTLRPSYSFNRKLLVNQGLLPIFFLQLDLILPFAYEKETEPVTVQLLSPVKYSNSWMPFSCSRVHKQIIVFLLLPSQRFQVF